MFIPHTPGSTLRNRFSKMEQNLGFKTRFKYIEQMGLSIREMVVKKDPDAQECGRSYCMVCLTEPGVCMRKGGIYKITCMTCKNQGESVVYVGETGRSLWDRGAEHFNAIRRYNKESPMVEHHTDAHPDLSWPADAKLDDYSS